MESSDAFTQRMWTVLSHGFLSAGIELGSRLGLFDYLATVPDPLTCTQIADAMKYKERYVKEWLGIMVCGGIMEIEEGRYYLPPHRHSALSGNSPMNAASFSWVSSICASVTDDILDCFKLDGPKGLPYSAYPTFYKWREHLMSKTFTSGELMKLIQLVPGLQSKLETGIEMCEIGCSTGVTAILFAQLFPNTTVHGYDISEEAVSCAKEKANHLGLKNVDFKVQDCCNMPSDWSNRFEFAYVYDMVHDVPESSKLLKELHRILMPGSFALIIDINMHTEIIDNKSNPLGALVYGVSLFHCMPVSMAMNGEGLGAAWGTEKAQQMIKDAGFSKVDTCCEDNNMQAIFVCHC